MTTDEATTTTTTHGQTGPRTEAGKAKSSRNAIRTGLYAARDFIRPEEEEEYASVITPKPARHDHFKTGQP